MYQPPELKTSQAELLGTTTGIIIIVIVAVIGLAVLIGLVYWADSHPGPDVTRERPKPAAADGGTAAGEIPPGQGQRPWQDVSDRHVPERGHPHGKPRSWALVITVILAFTAGGVAIILRAWPVVWACAAIILVALPIGKAIGIMDDTIAWGSTPAAIEDQPAGTVPERVQNQRSGTRPR